MPNLREMVDAEIDRINQERTSLPPLPVEPNGITDIPGPMPKSEERVKRRKAFEGAFDLFYKLGVPQAVGLTAEGTRRVDTAFRGFTLAAGQRLPVEDFPKFWDDAMSGKVNISGKDYNRMLFGAEIADRMKDWAVPLWSKTVMNPDPYLAGHMIKSKKKVEISAEGVAGLVTDLIVSPFTALSFMPAGAVTRIASKVPGGLKAVGVMNDIDRAITWPIRAPLNAAFSSVSTAPIVNFLFHTVDPPKAYVRHPDRLAALQDGPVQIQLKGQKFLRGGVLSALGKRHKQLVPRMSETSSEITEFIYHMPNHKSLDQIAIGVVARRTGAKRALVQATSPEVVAAKNELKQFIDDARKDFIIPLNDEVVDNGYDVFKRGKQVYRAKNPRNDPNQLFGAYEPARMNERWIPRPIGEKTIRQRGVMNIPWKHKKPRTTGQLDIWHAFDQTAQAIIGKTVWEARHKSAKLVTNPAYVAYVQRRRAAGLAGRRAAGPNRVTATLVRPDDPAGFFPPKALVKVSDQPPMSTRGFVDVTEIVPPKKISKEFWVNTGFVSKYRPKAGWGEKGVNPLLKNDTRQEFHYTTYKINDITGNARGRHMLEENSKSQEFWQSLEDSLASKAQKGRIRTYFWNKTKQLVDPFVGYNFPRFSRTTNIVNYMVNNTITATIGLNLGTAIMNTAALFNLGAAKTAPAMFRGIFAMAAPGKKGQILRAIRKESGVTAEFHRILHDDAWQYTVEGTLRGLLFKPFNLMENFVRGAAANVAVSEYMVKKGVKSYDELLRLMKGTPGASWRNQEDMFKFIRNEVYDTNFAYSVAGRSSMMMSPLAKLGFTLRSYMWKEADFIGRQWARDKTGVMRLFGMHGWAINNLDEWAGINAESWLGWGFAPPIASGDNIIGPQAQMLFESFQAQAALADGKEGEAEEHFRKMRGQIREVFKLWGMEDKIPGKVQAHLNAAAMMGFVPNMPIVAIAKLAKSANEFRTMKKAPSGKYTTQRTYGEDTTFKHIPWGDTVRSMFFRTHLEYADAQLREMTARSRMIVDAEMDQRVGRVLRALRSQDADSGTKVMEAATAAFDEIRLGYGTSPRRALLFRDQDKYSFFPHPAMFKERLQRKVLQSVVDRPVLEMLESGWLMEVFNKPYVDRSLFYLDQGAIRPLVESE